MEVASSFTRPVQNPQTLMEAYVMTPSHRPTMLVLWGPEPLGSVFAIVPNGNAFANISMILQTTQPAMEIEAVMLQFETQQGPVDPEGRSFDERVENGDPTIAMGVVGWYHTMNEDVTFIFNCSIADDGTEVWSPHGPENAVVINPEILAIQEEARKVVTR